MNAAILFEPDGYLLTGKIMGRQVAGNGFLRAAVHARGGRPLAAYTPSRESAEIFRQTVAEIDSTARTEWIPSQRLDLLAQAGVLYRPDQILGPMARRRLRVGPAAYSLCGVTHTLATSPTLDALAKILIEPVMPWDALVCTSSAALEVVETVLARQADYQRWRTGYDTTAQRPLLPVIPLGVHCSDFAFTDGERQSARQGLGLAPEDVAVLFAGRLSVSGKAHPFAMFHALQKAVEDTGKPVVLLISGQAANDGMWTLFQSGLAAFCPGVRTLVVDGRDPAAYRGAWAGADLFLSLADSIQETFGITPVEAMAAGLPALVSDWNGYKDTVRDGVDGFRIRTWTPPPGVGESIARAYETGVSHYEGYLSRSNMAVAVDVGELTARLNALLADGDLRRRMGAAGQARARAVFDWSVVFRQYQALWDEQTAIRGRALADPATRDWLSRAPRAGADHMGPFDTFAGYPTHHIAAETLVSRASDITLAGYRELITQQLLALSAVVPEVAGLVLGALEAGPATVGDLARATGIATPQMMEVVARLAKIDVVALTPAP
jgi:starch synthase